MNILRRAASLHHVRVLRVCFPFLHPPSTERATWRQAITVRPGPLTTRAPSYPYIEARRPLLALSLHRRAFNQLAQQQGEKKSPEQPTLSTKDASSAVSKAVIISNAEQRRRDWAIVRKLAVHIWPKDDWATRGRVVLGVGLLVCGKVRLVSSSSSSPNTNSRIFCHDPSIQILCCFFAKNLALECASPVIF
jgi:hypothetical protein